MQLKQKDQQRSQIDRTLIKSEHSPSRRGEWDLISVQRKAFGMQSNERQKSS